MKQFYGKTESSKLIFLCSFKFSMINSEVEQKNQHLWFNSLQIPVITLDLGGKNLELEIFSTVEAKKMLCHKSVN